MNSNDSDYSPSMKPADVDNLVRDFARDPEGDRKAALQSTLDNQRALYVRRAMARAESRTQSKSRGR